MKNVLNRSDRRIAILDIEASALGVGSYPIEVGVALVRGGPHPIEAGAKMIRPIGVWRESGLWSSASEAVHGLSFETLEQHGHDPGDVCDWLNTLLGQMTIVATDAPRYDQDWLDTLFDAANRRQQFTVYHFDVLTHDFSADQHRHLSYLLRRAPVPHRAAPDALRLATKLIETHLGYPPRTASIEMTNSDKG